MSELVDQISKLEAKAHALKESVSAIAALTLVSVPEKILGSFEKVRRVDSDAERTLRR
jgi:hypothetical protein